MNAIEKLKRFVVQSRDLSEPLNYFFDLTDADAFSSIKSHRVVKETNLYTELVAVLQVVKNEINERLGKAIKQLTPIFYEIPEQHFFHGTCLSGELMPIAVIYFSDVKTGVFAVTMGMGAKTDMMRFSLMEPSDVKKEALN
jgi:hypothetical protein